VPDVSYTLWQAEALTGAGQRLASLVEAALHPAAAAELEGRRLAHAER
jgi:hypothetical protein